MLKDSSTKLASRLATQVKIHVSTKERGEIKIAFTDTKELDRILKMLGAD
jgi:dsDNA-binding SOS-regulon protein